ncbi:hypothetical protein QQZ08_009645 [Neonectria magnoliae]|uniref:Glutathione S-transferase n=1 Tax=Neonectria magnoliae TaxID=2732573 RepID=A0ABR1HMW7_9HYPO
MARSPKIILYTSRQSLYAHRVYIALAELGLDYEEVEIDLDVPRTDAYLKINPRGKVPSLSYNGQVIIESAIITQFLADAHPSHLVLPSGSERGALQRARINGFVDVYMTQLLPLLYDVVSTRTNDEVANIAGSMVQIIVKELEPLLIDCGPYFGGSEKITLAEVLTASIVLRLYSSANFEILPKSLIDDLSVQAPNFSRWVKAIQDVPSICDIYDESVWVTKIGEKIAQYRSMIS